MRIKKLSFFYFLFFYLWIGTFYLSNVSFSTGNAGANCSTCHGLGTDGMITFTGLPTNYSPNSSYNITLCVTDNCFDIKAAGFTATLDKGTWSPGSGSKLGTGSGASGPMSITHVFKKNFQGGNSACWSFVWNSPTTGSGTANITYRGNAVDCNNDTAGDNGGYSGTASFSELALPVELLDFEAQAQDKEVLLIWSTASEHQNEFFEIQRSPDGVDFESIGRVEGAGDSYEVLTYEYLDEQPILDQKMYYRLRQVDFDGAFSFSRIQITERRAAAIEFEIFPNPTADFVNIKLLFNTFSNPMIEVRNTANQLVLSQNAEADKTKLDLSNLSNGLYVVSVYENGRWYRKSVLKANN